jgi:hypothetical protein
MRRYRKLNEVLAMSDTILKYFDVHRSRFVTWAANQPDLFPEVSTRAMQDYLLISINKHLIPADTTDTQQALKIIKQKLAMRPNTQNPAILNLIDQFCKLYNCTWEQLVAQSRFHWVVECRYLLMYFLFTKYRLSNSLIARLFNKHHSSVIHALRNMRSQIETDANFREYVERMETLLDINFTVQVEEIK